MKTKDSEHLQWLHDRIIEVYAENKNVDFLNRFREIIETTKKQEDSFEAYLDYYRKRKDEEITNLIIPKTTKEQRVQLNEGYNKVTLKPLDKEIEKYVQNHIDFIEFLKSKIASN